MPYGRDNPLTKKVNSKRRGRMWDAVYESSKERGDDEGTAIAKASGVVKKDHEKKAFLGAVLTAGRAMASRLPGALRVAGVGKRALVGAGVGAAAGGLTAPEGKRGRRMLLGAGLGAAGGALSSAGFRSAMMGKSVTPSAPGTALMRGASASVDVPSSMFKVSSATGYAKRADLSYDDVLTRASDAAIMGGWGGAFGSAGAQAWRSGHRAVGATMGGVGLILGAGAVESGAAAVRAADKGRILPSGSKHKVHTALGGGITSGIHGIVGHGLHQGGHSVAGPMLMAGAGARAIGTAFRVVRPPSSPKDDGGDTTPQPRERGK